MSEIRIQDTISLQINTICGFLLIGEPNITGFSADCDSGCRGFEPHQSPQIKMKKTLMPQGFQGFLLLAIRNIVLTDLAVSGFLVSRICPEFNCFLLLLPAVLVPNLSPCSALVWRSDFY